jgi:hypothetical protein
MIMQRLIVTGRHTPALLAVISSGAPAAPCGRARGAGKGTGAAAAGPNCGLKRPPVRAGACPAAPGTGSRQDAQRAASCCYPTRRAGGVPAHRSPYVAPPGPRPPPGLIAAGSRHAPEAKAVRHISHTSHIDAYLSACTYLVARLQAGHSTREMPLFPLKGKSRNSSCFTIRLPPVGRTSGGITCSAHACAFSHLPSQ